MLPLTRHGFREMLIGTLVIAVVIAVSLDFAPRWVAWPILILLLAVLAWLFAFFRDPERPISGQAHIMVSPADGLVSDVTELENYAPLGGPAVRVGIFLSVFNVHVNRSPCQARVLEVVYKKGRFLNAMNHSGASDQNESNTVLLGDVVTGQPIAVVKQIVGLIARRIIFTAAMNEKLERGQRIGMIKFGSRTELYIAKSLGPKILVRQGQKVRGGADIIAELTTAVHTETAVAAGEELEPLAPRQTPA